MKKILFGLMLGGIYGMFFAQKTGKQLIKEIKASPTPVRTFIKEGVKVDLAFIEFIQELCENHCECCKKK